jgi:hypothetical protein
MLQTDQLGTSGEWPAIQPSGKGEPGVDRKPGDS